MALLTPQAIVRAGLAPVLSAVNATDTITADGSTFVLHVKNANAGACTVTLTDAGSTPGGSSASNPTVTVPATTGERFIYIPNSLVNPATGLITVGYSPTASVTAALYRV